MNRYYLNKYFEPNKRVLWRRSLRRTLVLMILCGALLATLLLSSCKEKKQTEATATNKDVYYTCSMHPQVHEDHPGNCPICGMKLIAVPKTSASETTQIHLSAE